MYAAAGGASIASRQARQKQRQNKADLLKKASKGPDVKTPETPKPVLIATVPKSKQFHNLPSNFYNQFGKPKSSPVTADSSSSNRLRTPHTVASHRRNSSNVHPHLHSLKPSETVGGHLSKAKSTHKIHHSQSCMFATKDVHPNQFVSTDHHHHPHHTRDGAGGLVVPGEAPERKDSVVGLCVPVEESDEVLLGSDGRPLERRCSVRQHRQQSDDQHQQSYGEDNQQYLSYDNQNQLNQLRGFNENKPRWDICYGDDKYDCTSLDFPFSEVLLRFSHFLYLQVGCIHSTIDIH